MKQLICFNQAKGILDDLMKITSETKVLKKSRFIHLW